MGKFVNMNAVAPNNTDDGEPRGCFQVLAERKCMPSVKGYQNFRGSFDSLKAAKAFAEVLAADTDFYTGYEWVQVADVFHGTAWDLEDGTWIRTETDGAQ